ncbi:TPA: hypothetical protein N0F65_011233 [Lagenidium giganteum]|uniref:DDE Tnp4 domain-containing protein n=1 Tax=Lagenidium giganteum TaxID=4803 RepID=A0AAV2YQQ8_9STRA|nr:TPA: hypothetical protein N0F65_011233 [Lagenidium giganteum]
MTQKHRKRRAALCAVLLLLASDRDRHYLTRSSLDTPSASAWTALTNSKCDQSLINRSRIGRPSSIVHLHQALGLILTFYTSRMRQKTLCQLFGLPPATLSQHLAKAEVAVLKALRNALRQRLRGHEKNFQVQEPSSSDLQNAYYNGWLHSVLVTGTLCFDADGTIVWAKHNCPGSWNDGDISLEFCHCLLDVTKCPNQGLGVVSDSAFPCSKTPCGGIMTPLKDGELETIPNDAHAGAIEPNAAIAAILRVRQAAEWGVSSVKKTFQRRQVPLPFDPRKRPLQIDSIFRLPNFQFSINEYA